MTDESPQVVYGRLLEDAHAVTHYMERGQTNLAYLLEQDRWRKLGFSSINSFAKSLDLSELRQRVDERRQIVAALTDAGASSRAVAEALDVTHPTVLADRAVVDDLPSPSEGEVHQNGKAVEDLPPVPMLTLLTHTGQEVSYPGVSGASPLSTRHRVTVSRGRPGRGIQSPGVCMDVRTVTRGISRPASERGRRFRSDSLLCSITSAWLRRGLRGFQRNIATILSFVGSSCAQWRTSMGAGCLLNGLMPCTRRCWRVRNGNTCY